jgi:acyl-CoA thioesterase II
MLTAKLAAQAELEEMIRARPDGDGQAVGSVPDWFGPVAFGGFVIAQTLHAATTTVDASDGRRPHSLHCYFLRPVMAGRPVTYRISRVRDGRSFTTRRVEATQEDKLVCTMQCSFTVDTIGYEYELPVAGDVPDVDHVPDAENQGPWVERVIGPTEPATDGTRRSTSRAFFRLPGRLPEDPMLHATIVAMVSDMTLTGGRPLRLEGTIDGMVSLDHALWFHRPLRADEWIYYDVHSLVNTGGRGALRGTLHTADGRLAASVAQEMLLRVIDE